MAEVNNTATDPVLSSTEIDAIGEILNISMGSAATAISTMLDRQVLITTPRVEVEQFSQVSYAELEPALLVKIEYVEGLTGSNVMVFRQTDMQVILNLLMGNDEPPSEDFIFDEMSMSAACEVMNQMMGASATALSNFLGKAVNISTPTALPMSDEVTFEKAVGLSGDTDIVSVSFDIDITGVMNSQFVSIMTCGLARDLVGDLLGEAEEAVPVQTQPAVPPAAPPVTPPPAAAAAPAAPMAQPAAPTQPAPDGGLPGGQPAYPANGQPPMDPNAAPYGQPYPGYGAYPPNGQPPMDPYGQPYPGYGAYPPNGQLPMNPYGQPYPGYGAYPPNGQPPYGYPGAPGMPMTGMPQSQSGIIKQQQEVNVQTPQFPSFAGQAASAFGTPLTGSNMDLMMNVPLSISVEIGKTKRKIRDIMDFVQGTVIELEKQAGAPVDIVVNGQLIARGDVVVVDDNFGVRVTEIVGTKELMDSLENN